MITIQDLNNAFNRIPKRAESHADHDLLTTFADSGITHALTTVDHEIIYGRRGTGKTHALRYLSSSLAERDNIAIFVDLRTVGSPEGIFDEDSLSPVDRTSRVLVDVLGVIHDAILSAALDDSELTGNANFVNALDRFADAATSIRIRGEVSQTARVADETHQASSFGGVVEPGGGYAQARADSRNSTSSGFSETRRGHESLALNFSEVARALRNLAETLSVHRVWLLFDEWTSLPRAVQPFFAAFLQRCVLPLQGFTVKIAAIEQQAVFRYHKQDNQIIGIEVGADMAANLNLDDFMVFEQDEERAREFFLSLFSKHLSASFRPDEREYLFEDKTDLIKDAFTDTRAFDELVRAAEGVPRDAINIAAKAAWRAGGKKISIPDVRAASRQWYQLDKERALDQIPSAQAFLNWIIDRVIREKRARAFLVNQRDRSSDLLVALFEARVLHIVKRGYSAQDEPGERYDVYAIDYGAYVDLINTKYAPQGVLPLASPTATEEVSVDGGQVDVPAQDLRAVRRAVLDVSEFLTEVGGIKESAPR